jgi:hypothetical protein
MNNYREMELPSLLLVRGFVCLQEESWQNTGGSSFHSAPRPHDVRLIRKPPEGLSSSRR